MKPINLFTSTLAITALFVTACSTAKLAQNASVADDVYNTTAEAKTYTTVVESSNVAPEEKSDANDYYGNDDSYYESDYANRINRFYYTNPWRTYYDGYYGYSPYSLNAYWDYSFNNWYNPYLMWSYYGAPYYHNYGGPYLYYNPYYYGSYFNGGYGGIYYGGLGYYGGGYITRNNKNYGARPIRGGENGIGRPNGTGNYNVTRPNGTATTRTRSDMYIPNRRTSSNGKATSATPERNSNARPQRNEAPQRPTRSEAPPRPVYTPPRTQSAPPPTNNGGSRSGGSSSGSSRPTRGGR